MKTKWTKEVPKTEGWYWIKYRGKRGLVVCPAQVMWLGKQYHVATSRSDWFAEHVRKIYGFESAKFGNKIEEPI